MKPEAKWAAVLNLIGWFLILNSLLGLLISVLDMMTGHSVWVPWGDVLCIFGGIGLLVRMDFWRKCLICYFWFCLGLFLLLFLGKLGMPIAGGIGWRSVLMAIFYAGFLYLLYRREIKALFPPPPDRRSANE
jgi:hypothetical protein